MNVSEEISGSLGDSRGTCVRGEWRALHRLADGHSLNVNRAACDERQEALSLSR